jgi:hypothetical protein
MTPVPTGAAAGSFSMKILAADSKHSAGFLNEWMGFRLKCRG